ncbi:prolyl 4-hydroxylase alpha-subunit [Fragilaria crotonensis]|nr:prolyl 4-hydroxylase alpha-subunit [Fragilaria crotonensis]
MLISPLIILLISSADAFAPVSSGALWDGRRSSVLLAKVKKSASRSSKNHSTSTQSSSGRSGGFGAVPTTKQVVTNVQDDYAAFPALDLDVGKTLLPFTGNQNAPVADLPMDIYERLAHIYGFRSFNYLADEGETSYDPEPVLSFQDLLTSTGNGKPEAFNPGFNDLLNPPLGRNLDSLLVAPGRQATSTSIDAPPQGLAVSKLPPFEKFKVLHVDPLVISVEDFFTMEECDRYIAMSQAPPKNFDSPLQSRSKTVGKDSSAESQRTSTTWFHHYKAVPELMAKASRLFGLESIDRFEEPQTVRYRRSEKFTWHLDALAPGSDAMTKAGQRTATLLVYLTDLDENEGGATMFRDLGGPEGPMRVRPHKGSALLFFPAAGGIEGRPLDIRTLHCGEAVSEDSKQDKWIAQLWLREQSYKPTAPPGNTYIAATDAIAAYCNSKA